MYCETYSFLVIDATFTSDNALGFRKRLSERILKLIMTVDDTIREEKLQYDINREAAKIPALSSGKIYNMNFLQVKKYYLVIKEE